jgi:hypothetical protein
MAIPAHSRSHDGLTQHLDGSFPSCELPVDLADDLKMLYSIQKDFLAEDTLENDRGGMPPLMLCQTDNMAPNQEHFVASVWVP